MPSVLVETGFIDSAFDLNKLTGKLGQNAIAQSIADALVEYNEIYDKLNLITMEGMTDTNEEL